MYHRTGSVDSDYSNLSVLENETDEFGRRIVQHQRKVRRGESRRSVLATQDASEMVVEPPLNVPPQWGRRSRRQREGADPDRYRQESPQHCRRMDGSPSAAAVNRRNRKIDELTQRGVERVEWRTIERRITSSHSPSKLRVPEFPSREWTESVSGKIGYAETPSPQGRSGSYGLLKQLAKVSNGSPSPNRVEDRDWAKRSDAMGFEPTHLLTDPEASLAHLKPPTSLSELEGSRSITTSEACRARRERLKELALKELDLEGPKPARRQVNVSKSKPPEKPRIESILSVPGTTQAKSALTDVLKEIKSHHDDQFGDATIQSLENVADAPGDPTVSDLGEETQEILNNVRDEKAHLPKEDQTILNTLDKQLTKAHEVVKDATEEMKRVEDQINSAPKPPLAIKNASPGAKVLKPASDAIPVIVHTPPKTPNTPPVRVKTPDHGSTCPTCGGQSYKGSLLRALFSELLSLIYIYTPDARWHRRIKLTPLGRILAFAVVYYLLENVLSWFFSYPREGAYMEGWGVDPDAPEYPFVIPTLLLRTFRPLWRPVWESYENRWEGGRDTTPIPTATPAPAKDAMKDYVEDRVYEELLRRATETTVKVVETAKWDGKGEVWVDEVF